LPVTPGPDLLTALETASEAVDSPDPLSFGELGLSGGLVLYRAHPLLPHGPVELGVSGLHDRAQVFVDGEPAGVLDRETGTLALDGAGRAVRLDLLVENQGRINYGPLLGQGKGILGAVRIDRRRVHRWTMRPLPLDEWTADHLDRVTASPEPSATPPALPGRPGGAGFATAGFTADGAADTFLAFPGFRKGFVWINGFLLGRYWNVGPQTTLYLPAPLTTAGDNTLTLLELEESGDRVELREHPELGPPQEYVETFD
ncbi:beta-galactosidase, partial [Streptomyces sp. 4F]